MIVNLRKSLSKYLRNVTKPYKRLGKTSFFDKHIPQGIVFSALDNNEPLSLEILKDLGVKAEIGEKISMYECRTKTFDVRYLVFRIEHISLDMDYVYIKTVHKSIFDKKWKESQLRTKAL